MRIALVAAEPSGDVLAAGLMSAIRKQIKDVQFEGIGGPLMLQQGMDSWHPMETLSVMGLVEVLKHLPKLLGIRKDLVRRWLKSPPDLFIGIDAPDFNLALETKLKQAGIPTVHYVCPTVWAWRPGRVKTLRKATNLVLSIFPFEKSFLQQHAVDSCYVGHPLAKDYPLQADRKAACMALDLDPARPILALLPGSRRSEVETLSPPFLQSALLCREQIPGLQIVTPLANDKTQQLFEAQMKHHAPDLQVSMVQQKSQLALTAADVVLVASGTATFEALLCKRPMVVGYRLHWLTWYLVTSLNLVKVDNVAMANLLSAKKMAPEFLQNECTAEKMAPALLKFFNNTSLREEIADEYLSLHQSLIMDTNEVAAKAVLKEVT